MAKARSKLGRQTFDSAAAAANTFYEGNALYFDHISDPIDGLRAWADGIDVRTGKRTSQRLGKSAAGRKILESGQGRPQILAALQWVFQQAPGRRWDAVDWTAIDDLGALLEPHYEPPAREPGTPGLYWQPIIGAGKPVSERLEELEPPELLELGQLESAEGLRVALEELRETYEETRECLSPRLRATVERRIAEWSRWDEDPTEIPAYACEPDAASGGYVCNYPLVTGELRELRGACRQAYDPDWFVDEASAELPGFPPLEGPRGLGPIPEENGEAVGEREDLPIPDEPLELEADELEAAEDLRLLQSDGRAYGGPVRDLVEHRVVAGIEYQLEYRTCGKQSVYGTPWCRCIDPPEKHGPYWYGYYRDARTGRRRSFYVGKNFSEDAGPRGS